MKKSTFIAMMALLVSVIGVLIALVAYFKRKQCALCDDYEDDLDLMDDSDLDYYDVHDPDMDADELQDTADIGQEPTEETEE